MSDDNQDNTGATKPVAEHAWLQNLVGEWQTETQMTMPDGQVLTGSGRESVKSLGGLWAYSEASGTMPNGETMHYYSAVGYDVSFKEYRGCWFADVSSHLWKQTGVLSADGKRLTLTCEGPHMAKDGETALYRDVIELIDHDTRTLTSSGQDDEGNWHQFMVSTYRRV